MAISEKITTCRKTMMSSFCIVSYPFVFYGHKIDFKTKNRSDVRKTTFSPKNGVIFIIHPFQQLLSFRQ